jgi:hypothetical protein
MNVQQIGVPEFVLRVLLRPGDGDLVALITPTNEISRVQRALVDELTLRSEKVLVLTEVKNARSLVARLVQARQKTAVVTGLDAFDEDDWRALDSMRSMLSRPAPIILILLGYPLDSGDHHM